MGLPNPRSKFGVVEKFEGSVHCEELPELCVRMTENFKSNVVPIRFPNEDLESFDQAKGAFMILQDDWLIMEEMGSVILFKKK